MKPKRRYGGSRKKEQRWVKIQQKRGRTTKTRIDSHESDSDWWRHSKPTELTIYVCLRRSVPFPDTSWYLKRFGTFLTRIALCPSGKSRQSANRTSSP